MAYKYQPLADPDNEIHLVIIQPGAVDDAIRVDFRLRHLKVSTRDGLLGQIHEL
jgi:hypothetical protein